MNRVFKSYKYKMWNDETKAKEYLELGYKHYTKALGYKKTRFIKAFSYFEKSANLGNEEAQYMCYKFYIEGLGVDLNSRKAMKWLKKSAKSGFHKARGMLGTYYYYGRYVKKDYEKAMDLFKKANQEEDSMLYLCRAMTYMYESTGDKRCLKKAYRCLKEAHKLGNDTGTYYLAECYYKGIGVEKDIMKAMEFYKEAFENGYRGESKSLFKCLKEVYLLYKGYESEVLRGKGDKFIELVKLKKKMYWFSEIVEYYKDIE